MTRVVMFPGRRVGFTLLERPPSLKIALTVALIIACTTHLQTAAWLIQRLTLTDSLLLYFPEHPMPSKSYNFSISTEDYLNPEIVKKGCGITVVFMDPSIDTAALWALESAAHYLEPSDQVCIVLHTSACLELSLESKAQRIQSQAQPHFRQLIQQGQVRMSVLDHTFYRWKTCSNFYSPNNAWTNYHYWSHEFSSKDADFVLTLQSDAVLCRPLKFENWLDAAWVGAPWPPEHGRGPYPWNHCEGMPRNWQNFHQYAAEDKKEGNAVVPAFPYTPDEFCSQHEIGPQGNGGLSLRKRSWLLKAIEYCPTSWSGLDEATFQKAICHARDQLAEDWYFLAILRGLNAPLPSALDAALFALETTHIESIQAFYNISDNVVEQRMAVRGTSERIGIHKPWPHAFFWPQNFCKNNKNTTIQQDCPYFIKIVENSKSAKKALAQRGHPPCWKQ